MSVENFALLFIGYLITELDQVFTVGGDVEEEWKNIQEEVDYMKLGTELDIKDDEIVLQWSSAHEQYLVGVLIANSGAYNFETLVLKDLFEKLIHSDNALKLIFRKEPKLYIMNRQW